MLLAINKHTREYEYMRRVFGDSYYSIASFYNDENSPYIINETNIKTLEDLLAFILNIKVYPDSVSIGNMTEGERNLIIAAFVELQRKFSNVT